MMSIKAKMVNKTILVELPLNNSNGNLYFLERYLKERYTFNKEKGQFECLYRNESGLPYILIWRMRSTLRRTIINTFEGSIFPFEKDVRRIIYPVIPQCFYTLEGKSTDSDEVIKTLFKKHFEIIGLTTDGTLQTFRRKDNEVKLLYRLGDKFELSFKGHDNTSRAVLSAFSVI
jgi:hypothetical protein